LEKSQDLNFLPQGGGGGRGSEICRTGRILYLSNCWAFRKENQEAMDKGAFGGEKISVGGKGLED